MKSPSFFGYGSLVNLATHDYAAPRAAVLTGWQRRWVQTDLRAVPFLSIEPAKDVTIAGVLADVPGGDWSALDVRETGYDRIDISAALGAGTAVYQVSPRHVSEDLGREPILLSYLDVVVQGFYRMYGTEGVTGFFATTTGWDRPILNDRSAPRYPRHQTLTQSERRLVDIGLETLAAQVQQPV